ncbi:3-isopropylmalate dehydratase small subunit [Paraburkholderia sp. MM5482-R1]|uniref:3-isopropylmalate dehydratase small subunit n=1 Tax=unclassified Paraburkholderia TaxID=2615204 RepID=UPI003D1DDE59
MQPFVTHTGIAVPLERDNVDTDAIMPKQFMKAIARTGFGPYVFDEWRFEDSGYYGKPATERLPKPDFVLNRPRYAGASILLAGRNFGCGSSREHAPWALQQYGFRVLIARSFADIFYNNCCKNGMLPVVLTGDEISYLFKAVDKTPGYQLCVDLLRRSVSASDGFRAHFDMELAQRTHLIEGIDEVGATLKHAEEITNFEATYLGGRPWL